MGSYVVLRLTSQFFYLTIAILRFHKVSMSTSIRIEADQIRITDCESVVLIPEMALQEAGFIKTFTVKDSGSAKHEFHALAQMAYFQYQDDELEIIEVDSPLLITFGPESVKIESGMVLYRDQQGGFHVLANGSLNRKKILEAAYRYCTRWVRLDI